MYSIGEFARIAQVSKRQLHYWDEIGLLQPGKVDPSSGHRFYSATQLSTLNRIIAFKALGLSLSQIRRFLQDDMSLDKIEGMLLMKKSELELQVQEELQRIRTIESRLKQIREQGIHARDVVVKDVPEQQYVSTQIVTDSWEDTMQAFGEVSRLLPEPNNDMYGYFLLVLHADGVATETFEIQVGRLINSSTHTTLAGGNGNAYSLNKLEAATMATFVHSGPSYEAHIGYSAIGEWMEANEYIFAGPCRELVLRWPTAPDYSDLIMEIQFPIQKRTTSLTN